MTTKYHPVPYYTILLFLAISWDIIYPEQNFYAAEIMSASSPPHYKDLPTEKSTGSKCSWGIFDEDGLKDEIGALNLLTPSVVLEAAKEIKTGKSVSLNWGLENMQKPIGNRCPLLHTIIDWRKTGHTIYCHDDEIKMNTQSGRQTAVI